MSTPKPGVPIQREPLPSRPEPPPVGGSLRDTSAATRVSWILGGALLLALALVVGQVLSHFATALTWAVILAVSLWPVHRRIRARLGDRSRTAASLTLLLVTLGVVVPVT